MKTLAKTSLVGIMALSNAPSLSSTVVHFRTNSLHLAAAKSQSE